MTLYDLNKSAYAALPKMTSAEKENAKVKISNYISHHSKNDRDYFMLLNNEAHYYTIFCWARGSVRDIVNEVISIAEELGELRAIEVNDNDAIEFWIANKQGECNMFVFFDYTKGVIEV